MDPQSSQITLKIIAALIIGFIFGAVVIYCCLTQREGDFENEEKIDSQDHSNYD